MFDAVTSIGPLIGVVIADFDGTGVDSFAVHKKPGNLSLGHVGVISQVNPTVIRLVMGQLGINKRLILAM